MSDPQMIRFPLALPGGFIADDHRVAEVRLKAGGALISVSSYGIGSTVRVAVSDYPAPAGALDGATMAAAAAWLVSADGPFAGGELVDDEAAADMAAARAAAIARLEAERQRMLAAIDAATTADEITAVIPTLPA